MPNTNLRPVIMSAFGPPALACIRSWGRKGLNPGMICIRNEYDPDPASKYLDEFLCLTRNDLFIDHGLKQIAEFLTAFNASGLICIEEKVATWLNDNREKLPKETTLWLPTNDMIQRSLSKTLQIETARVVGFELMLTYLFRSAAEVADSIYGTDFPLCLRPSEPDSVAPHFKVQNVQTIDELRHFLENHTITAPVIGQPFMNLPNLVVHGSRTVKGETLGLHCFLVERKFQGVTLTIRPVEIEEGFKQKCIAFTDTMDLVGHYHFEFLHDSTSGKNYFLEFNHRFGGTTAKVLACGYDEPAYGLQTFGVNITVTKTINDCTVSNMKALIKSMLYALSGKLTPLDYPQESKMRRIWFTLKSLVLCRDEVFAWDDLQGTSTFYLGKYYATIMKFFLRYKGTQT